MRKNVKQSIIFISLVYLLSWIFWLPLIKSNNFSNLQNLFLLIGIYMPSTVGILMTKKYVKKSSEGNIFMSLFKNKISIKEAILILSYFPIMIILFFVIGELMGNEMIPFNYPLKVFPLVFFYILLLQGPLGEEFGWRGFLLKRLMISYNVIISSLLIGFLWSFWHLPLFFIQWTIQWQMMQQHTFLGTISGYIFYTILISILISIVFLRTNKSVWAAILFHTIANTTIGYAPIIMTTKGSIGLLIALVMVTIIAVQFNMKHLIENRK